MTPNDAEIDVLMRRFAGNARSDAMPEHLDADELNAFAEGALPPAARMRYVSHLADCDNCRKLASQLAMSAGAVAKAEPIGSIKPEPISWSQRLAALFAPRTLRYAAFAVVLIAAAGVVFLVARRPNETSLVARNEQANQTSVLAEKQNEAAAQPSVSTGTLADSTRPAAVSSPVQSSNLERERDESKVASNTTPPKSPAETSVPTTSPLSAEKRAEPAMAKSPSYAPPPPGEGQKAVSGPRQQQTGGGISGPQKTDSSVDKYQARDQAQTTVAARERQATDDSNRAAMNQPAPSNRRVTEEKRSGPSRNMDQIAATGRTNNEQRIEALRKVSPEAAKAKEETPETRSVGGRKFQRQGNGWVDVKFKSSMSVRNVSRGSEEFGALDSGLRSIAQQLGGEITVVWKNKAYRIR